MQETWLHEQEFINKFKKYLKDVECISANKFDLGGINTGTKILGVVLDYAIILDLHAQSKGFQQNQNVSLYKRSKLAKLPYSS